MKCSWDGYRVRLVAQDEIEEGYLKQLAKAGICVPNYLYSYQSFGIRHNLRYTLTVRLESKEALHE